LNAKGRIKKCYDDFNVCFVAFCICTVYSSQLNSLVVTTPPSSDGAVNQQLVISIVLNDGPKLNTSHRFIYRLDPRFLNIEPRSHLLVYVQ